MQDVGEAETVGRIETSLSNPEVIRMRKESSVR